MSVIKICACNCEWVGRGCSFPRKENGEKVEHESDVFFKLINMSSWKETGADWIISVGLGGGVETIKRKKKMEEKNFGSGKVCGPENLCKHH